MGKRVPYEMPAAMKEAQQRFERWRSSQSGRRPLPEPLWVLATDMGREHGIARTAEALRLDYTKLAKRVRGATPVNKSTAQPKPAPPATFVELLAQPASHTCECVIELEGPRGRMRIEWKGTTAPDLAGFSRVLWEPGA
jgi:hypothetical protein